MTVLEQAEALAARNISTGRLVLAAIRHGFTPADLPLNLVDHGDGRNWALIADETGDLFPSLSARRAVLDMLAGVLS